MIRGRLLRHSPFPFYGLSCRLTLMFVVLCIVLQWPGSAARAQACVAPTGLQCEYRYDPLGMDVKQPRLSWKLSASNPEQRGQVQTTYQILVSNSKEGLDRRHGW